MIQEGGLFPHLTAAANVMLMARHEGWSGEKSKQRLAELVEMTRFPADGLNRYPSELSGGQRQRLSLMRALFLSPRLLLLDEPLGALDPMIRAGLQRDLKAVFAQSGATVLLVTHDLVEASWFADRVCVLEAGRIVRAHKDIVDYTYTTLGGGTSEIMGNIIQKSWRDSRLFDWCRNTCCERNHGIRMPTLS